MKKSLPMKNLLTVVVFFLSLSMAWAQQPTFKEGIRTGQIKVKFKPEMASTLSQTTVNARTTGFSSGIQSVDNAAKATKASNMYRLFPYDPKFESKLRKHGLHLWYVVEIDETIDPKVAVAQFKQLNEVAVAELEHQKVLAPYEVKSYVPTASTLSVLPFNDPLLKDQWHYDNSGQFGIGDGDVNAVTAWQTVTGSNEVIVSVHDQGVDVKHVDLKANIWVNAGEIANNGIDDDGNGYVDDINGYNFQKNVGAIDPENHGTHVAGTIAAVNNNGIGVSGIAGGNGSGNGVKIMSLQILGGAPIEKSFVYAANNGAVISQNSWGYSAPGSFDLSVRDAIDYFIAEAGDYVGSPMRGGIVLFAAGNNNYDADWYPGYYESTMSVASIGPEWKKAPYSNFGTWVEISAPGGDGGGVYGPKASVLSTIPKDQYAYMQGTSMACPHVSGIAALAVANRTHQMTSAELWNKLVTAVVNIDKQNPDYVGKLGSGAIDAGLAVKNDQKKAPVAITNVTATDIAQEFAKLSWTVPADEDDAQPLKFNIYYGIDTVTLANLVVASKVTIKNDSLAGKTFFYEVGNLLGLRQYDFVVTSIDRWGNESVFSNILEITTNAGPAIAVAPVTIGGTSQSGATWTIDAAVSKISTQPITIQNNAAGLLRYSSFMRSRVASTLPTFIGEDIIYPVVPPTSPASSNVIMVGAEEDTVEKLYSNEPAPLAFVSVTKKLISGSATNLIGETDTSLPNSAAARFKVTEAGGFNLTRVTMVMKLTRPATIAEPVVVEIYKGTGLTKENRLYAQTYTSSSLNQQTAFIPLDEQLYFAQGESFFVVFHIPNGNLFPLGMGFDADPNMAAECYYSANVGATWQPMDDAINDKRFAWAMETFSGNADIGTFLSLAPPSGDISGMTSSDAVITADVSKLINGNYAANLVLPSNDGAKPELRVPVYLKVSNHQPVVKIIDVVDYTTVFVGAKKSFDVIMDNQGYGRIAMTTPVTTANYILSGPGASQFIVENSSPIFRPSSIPARDQAPVRVTYAPTASGPANATLTITGKSGNNVNYTYTVSLFGVGAETTKIALTPESQVKTPIAIGQTVSADITVQNIGGYPLKYFIPGYDTKGVSDNWPTTYQKYGYKQRTAIYTTDPISLGVFQDIKTTGVDITSQILTDRTWATVDIGFDFPYYGKMMKTIYVAQCSKTY
jgi:subtilisin family serine protease